MTEIEKKLSELNGITDIVLEQEYASKVERKIRRRYTLGAELSILRRRDEKPEAFAEYNAYAEQCKAEAKEEVYGK